MNNHLHIISFNVPYPVNYGGVIDVYYKMVALHQLGIKVHLHCFDYGRGNQDDLNQYCASVHYYAREKGHKAISRKLPYIVASRNQEELLQRLLQDDYPIFMEGVHCSYLLMDDRFKHRKCFVRLHNVEYQYYQELYKSSTSWLRKLYYWNESRLLHKYESALAKRTNIVAISLKDQEVYQKEFHCTATDLIPLFLPNWELGCKDSMGTYCLYHGDLSIDANERAVIWLIDEVFSKLKMPLVITGKNPSEKLIERAHEQQYTCLVENPTDKELQDMITKAHINLIPSYTTTGIKVKFLNALKNGKHCIANNATMEGSGLEKICHNANTAQEFQELIAALFEIPFTAEDRTKRDAILSEKFNNQKNAELLIQKIWS